MSKRNDYEHQELDSDGCYYWFTNSDVQHPYKEPLLRDFLTWWREHEQNTGLYYKGTALYFTFNGVKYRVSWTFTAGVDFDTAISKLKSLGAENIQINWGELD